MSSPTLQAAELCFPSPLFTFEIPQAQALNRELLRIIAACQAASAGISVSNQHGWHSSTDFFLRPDPALRVLLEHLVAAVTTATQKIAPQLDLAARVFLMQGWVNVNGRGAYNSPHAHAGHEWSGCYYVKVPEASPNSRSGCIEFLDPRGALSQMDALDSGYFKPKVRKQPHAGMLLLFPAYLRHWVYPNDDDEARVSIAFNARVKLADELEP